MKRLQLGCFLAVWTACGSSIAAPAPVSHYTITDLGANVVVMAINESGDAVGYRLNGGFRDAVIYTNGVLHYLVLQGSTNCGLSGINNSQNAVGWYWDGARIQHVVISNQVLVNLSVSDAGGLFSTPLVTPGAYSINESNQIAGSDVVSNSPVDVHYRGYVITNLTDRRVTDFSVAGSDTLATHINHTGAVSGFSSVAYLYTNGVVRTVPTPPTAWSYAYGVNDSNDMAIAFTPQFTPPVNSPTGYLYSATSSSFQNLGHVSTAFPFTEPVCINNYTQLVGFALASPASSHAFLYDPDDGMQDLNDLIDPASGWLLTGGKGINDAGQIIAQGTLGGVAHACLLTPTLIFDPTSITVIGCNVTFKIRGLRGTMLTIQAADDCMAWFDFTTVTLGRSGTTFNDPGICTNPNRYRAVIE